MADKQQAQFEDEMQKKLMENPMFDSLVNYLMNIAPGGKSSYIVITKDVSVFNGSIKYGRARLSFDFYVENNGAVNTLVFDFRDIYDRIVAHAKNQDHTEGSDCEAFVYDVLKQAGFDNHYVCLFENYQDKLSIDKDEYSTFGISLINYEDNRFNKFTPWAGVLFKVLEALDAVNGFTGTKKLNKLTREEVDKCAKKLPFRFWLIMIAGYALILVGLIMLFSSWPAWLKWILGIILIIIGLICGPNFTWFAVSNRKEYENNSGDLLKKFHKPSKKIFYTIKD